MDKPHHHNHVNLLWTGGLDSTFRLCELLLLKKQIVQPYYIIDPNRHSLRYEIKAHKKIKRLLIQTDPSVKKNMLPTYYFIAPDEKYSTDIEDGFNEINKITRFGIQFKWLANFCEQHKLYNLELGAEKSGSPRYIFFKRNLKRINYGSFRTYVIDQYGSDKGAYEIFKYFQFPIIDKTKLDMFSIGANFKFQHILEASWFCHNPVHGKPCGRCNPCKDVVKYGLKYRLPVDAKLRYITRLFSKTSIRKLFFL